MARIYRHLTDEQKLKIFAMAHDKKKPSPSRIAYRLKVHPSTVAYFMRRSGLLVRRKAVTKNTFVRAGVPCYPFTPEQDARLLKLWQKLPTYQAIATAIGDEFGVERLATTVANRILVLRARKGKLRPKAGVASSIAGSQDSGGVGVPPASLPRGGGNA